MPRPLKVLILEDNPSDAELMVIELRRAGFLPAWERVETEAEYLAALETQNPKSKIQNWDVILADYSLPQFDGLRALQLMKDRGLDVPFIVVTGALGDEKTAECVRQGAADYLLKDRLARLGPAVDRAMQEANEKRKLKTAEEALRRSHAELEARVLQRTAELSQANERLRDEIAERTRIEAALRESEQRYRTLAETAPDHIFMVGPDGRVQYVNAFAARAVGREPNDVAGKSLTEIFPAAVAERQWHNLQGVFESGSPRYVQNQTVFPTPTGDGCDLTYNEPRVRWLNTWLVPVKDEAGKVVSVFGIARDVTDVVRIEGTLRARETQLRMAVEQMPTMLWTTDTELVITSLMGRAGHRAGEEDRGPWGAGREAVGVTLADYFRPATDDARRPTGAARSRGTAGRGHGAGPESLVVAAHRRALQGESVRLEVDLGDRTYDTREEPLRDADGRIVGTLGIANDITARKQAEAALRDREERYRNLFENAPIGIYRSTPEGRILMANPALLRMLRYSSFYEISLRNLESDGFESAGDRRRFQEQLTRTGEIRGREATWTRSDGSALYVRENARVVRDTEGKALYYEGSVEDITDRRIAEERLFHLNAVLRAIRNVNELIVRERDRDRLLTGICENLVATRGYRNAWIVLRNPSTRVPNTQHPAPGTRHSAPASFFSAAQPGSEPEIARVRDILRQDALPAPVQEALVTPDVFIWNPGSGVGDQGSAPGPRHPVPGTQSTIFESRTMSVRLAHSGHVYGALVVSIPQGLPAGNDEQTLFREVGADIGYALHTLEAEEERRWAQAALETSESRYRALIEKIADGVYMLDTAGRFTFVNEPIARRSGRTAAEFVGRSFLEIVRPEDHARVQRMFDAVMRGETPGPYELAYPNAAGTLVRVEVNTAPLREAGKIVGLLGVSRDITPRKQAELALRESEENFRALAENANDAILIADEQGRHIYANQRAAQVTGYSTDELLTTTLKDLADAGELPKLRERLEMRLRGEVVPDQYETALRRKDGARVELEVTGAKTTWRGQVADLVVIRDISERKRAEEALRQSEERYRSVVEVAPDPVIIHRQGRIVFVNPAALRFGTGDPSPTLNTQHPTPPSLALIGTPIMDFVHPDSRPLVAERMRVMTEEGKPVPLAVERFIRFDGSIREVEVAARPIVYEGLPSIMVVFRDISERKQAEDALRQSEMRFRTLFEASPAPVGIDRTGTNLYVNPAYHRLFGFSADAKLAGTPLLRRIAPQCREEARELTRRREAGETVPDVYETIGVREDGTQFPLQVLAARIQLTDGPATVGFLTDLTEQKQAETRLARLNRLYAVMSHINEAIVRIREPDKLCQEACRLAVEEGGFRFAWIGMIDFDTRLIKPIARAGHDEGYLDRLRISTDEVRGGLGPTGTAVREGHSVVVNDVARPPTPDPQHPTPDPQHWREEADRREYRSVAAFPLRVGREIVGSLTLYDHEPEAFGEESLRLLEALAADIGYALELSELEQRRRAADEELRENEQRFRTVFEEGIMGAAIIDPDRRLVRVNPAFGAILGYTPQQLLGLKLDDIIPAEEKRVGRGQGPVTSGTCPSSPVTVQITSLLAGRISSYRAETRLRRSDQTDCRVTIGALVVRDQAGKVLYAVIMIEDIRPGQVNKSTSRQVGKSKDVGT